VVQHQQVVVMVVMAGLQPLALVLQVQYLAVVVVVRVAQELVVVQARGVR